MSLMLNLILLFIFLFLSISTLFCVFLSKYFSCLILGVTMTLGFCGTKTFMKKSGIYFCLMVSSFILTMNLWAAYVYFEATLVLMLIMILSMGLNPYRLSAMFWMMSYSILFSTPNLIFFIFNNKLVSPTMLLNPVFLSSWSTIFMYLMFFTKVPVYLLHFWLPKAHAEASTSGSVFLAALLLKLGTFGCLKIFLWMKKGLNVSYFMLSSCFILVACFHQSDMKKLIALTSVFHMAVSLALLFSNTFLGMLVFYLINICHTIVSASFFYTAGIFMKMSNSRIMYLQEMIKFSLKMFLLMSVLLANMGVPPFFSFFTELMAYSLLFKQMQMLLFFIFMLILSTIGYSFLLINNMKYGFNKNLKPVTFMKPLLSLFLLSFLLFL